MKNVFLIMTFLRFIWYGHIQFYFKFAKAFFEEKNTNLEKISTVVQFGIPPFKGKGTGRRCCTYPGWRADLSKTPAIPLQRASTTGRPISDTHHTPLPLSTDKPYVLKNNNDNFVEKNFTGEIFDEMFLKRRRKNSREFFLEGPKTLSLGRRHKRTF